MEILTTGLGLVFIGAVVSTITQASKSYGISARYLAVVFSVLAGLVVFGFELLPSDSQRYVIESFLAIYGVANGVYNFIFKRIEESQV